MFEAALALLKIASLVLKWVDQRQHFTAGQKDQLLKATNEVIAAGKISREIRKDVEQMTEEELDKELMS